MIVISSFRCGPANFLPPNGILYIFFLSFSSLLFFSFFHSYMMITIKCRYHIAAHSQLPFGEFTNGYHTARRPVFESEESLSLFGGCPFFSFRVFSSSSNLTFPVEIPRKKTAAGLTIFAQQTHG